MKKTTDRINRACFNQHSQSRHHRWWVLLSFWLLVSLTARADLLVRYTFDDNTNTTFAADSGLLPPLMGLFKGASGRLAAGQTPSGSGYALDLNLPGATNYLSVSNAIKLNNLTRLTITAWINLQADPALNDRLVSKLSTAGPGFDFKIQSGTATNVQLGLAINSTTQVRVPSLRVDALNKWAFVAVTYDSTITNNAVNFYAGGVTNVVSSLGAFSSLAAWGTTISNTTADLRLGATFASGADRTPPVWMDDVRVYNTVLTALELEGIREEEVPYVGGPAILAQPQGQAVLVGGSATFGVSALPISPTPAFQWRVNGDEILGGTNAFYTVSNAVPEVEGLWFDVIVSANSLSITSQPAFLTVQTLFDTPVMTNFANLSAPAGTNGVNYLSASGNLERCMAYNPATTNLIIVHRTGGVGTPTVFVLDALTASYKNTLDQSALINGGYAGTFPLNMVDAADDGAVYAANMTFDPSSVPYTLYRWPDDSSGGQAVAFSGDPGAPNYPNLRWGDNLAVRGSGVATEVLIAATGYTNFVTSPPLVAVSNVVSVLQTADGSTFTSTAILITNAPTGGDGPFGFANTGLAWGPGSNTFYAKSASNQLVLVEFDLGTGLGGVKHTYSFDSVPETAPIIGVDNSSGLLGAIDFHRVDPQVPGYDSLRLYDISNPTNEPVLLDQELLGLNSSFLAFRGVGSVQFATIGGTNFVFVLHANMGLKAFTIDATKALQAPTITQLSPVAGPSTGGTLVTISGTNFVNGLTVQFGDGIPQTAYFSNPNTVSIHTPASAPGQVDVKLVNLDGQSFTLTNGFTFESATPPPPAMLEGIANVGGNLQMVWSGGTNSVVWLHSGTNLAQPLAAWDIIATNFVGADGLSTNLIPINPAEVQRYFRLSIPY